MKVNPIIQEWHEQHIKNLYCEPFTTTRLARFLDCSPKTIERWCQGKNQPSFGRVEKVKHFMELVKRQQKQALSKIF